MMFLFVKTDLEKKEMMNLSELEDDVCVIFFKRFESIVWKSK